MSSRAFLNSTILTCDPRSAVETLDRSERRCAELRDYEHDETCAGKHEVGVSPGGLRRSCDSGRRLPRVHAAVRVLAGYPLLGLPSWPSNSPVRQVRTASTAGFVIGMAGSSLGCPLVLRVCRPNARGHRPRENNAIARSGAAQCSVSYPWCSRRVSSLWTRSPSGPAAHSRKIERMARIVAGVIGTACDASASKAAINLSSAWAI